MKTVLWRCLKFGIEDSFPLYKHFPEIGSLPLVRDFNSWLTLFVWNTIWILYLQGEISWATSPKPFPAEPAPLPPVDKMTRMVYIFASEYVVNSYAYTAFTHGLVSYNLSRERVGSASLYSCIFF